MTAYLSDGAQAMLRELLKGRGVRRPSVIETALLPTRLWHDDVGYYFAGFGYEGRTTDGKIALVTFALRGWHHCAAPILIPIPHTCPLQNLTTDSLTALMRVQEALLHCLVHLAERRLLSST